VNHPFTHENKVNPKFDTTKGKLEQASHQTAIIPLQQGFE